MSTGRPGYHGGNGLLAPEEERGAGASCQTEPAPLPQTITPPLDGSTGERLPHCISHAARDDAARPLRVEYRQSGELSPEECRRRIRLAYACLLDFVPWPSPPATEAHTDAEVAGGAS